MAVFGGLVRLVGKGHVMTFDCSVDVCAVAVANFVTVVLEYMAKFVQGWEVFVNELRNDLAIFG